MAIEGGGRGLSGARRQCSLGSNVHFVEMFDWFSLEL